MKTDDLPVYCGSSYRSKILPLFTFPFLHLPLTKTALSHRLFPCLSSSRPTVLPSFFRNPVQRTGKMDFLVFTYYKWCIGNNLFTIQASHQK